MNPLAMERKENSLRDGWWPILNFAFFAKFRMGILSYRNAPTNGTESL
jgi:hypothetical protein